MEELLYTAFDVACIALNLDLSARQTLSIAKKMYDEENTFLAVEYRTKSRKWLLDILYWAEYMQDKITLDAEFPSIQAVSDGKIDIEAMMREDFNIDLFFKQLRVKILYLGKNGYVRMKLRTLMTSYGYKRRSKEFIKFIKYRLKFYHIQTTLKGKESCDVETMNNLGRMITFRVI